METIALITLCVIIITFDVIDHIKIRRLEKRVEDLEKKTKDLVIEE